MFSFVPKDNQKGAGELRSSPCTPFKRFEIGCTLRVRNHMIIYCMFAYYARFWFS